MTGGRGEYTPCKYLLHASAFKYSSRKYQMLCYVKLLIIQICLIKWKLLNNVAERTDWFIECDFKVKLLINHVCYFILWKPLKLG